MKSVSLELGTQNPKYTGVAQEAYKGSTIVQERESKLLRVEALVQGGCRRDVAITHEGYLLPL